MLRNPAIAIVLLLGDLGCDVPQPSECGDDVRPSVTLVVVDGEEQRVAGAMGSFRVDDGQAEPCDSLGDGLLLCGWESAGAFDVRVGAPGFVPHEVQVDVEEGRCHVLTVDLTIDLTPEENG